MLPRQAHGGEFANFIVLPHVLALLRVVLYHSLLMIWQTFCKILSVCYMEG